MHFSTDDYSAAKFFTVVANLSVQCAHDNSTISQLSKTNQKLQSLINNMMMQISIVNLI